MAAFSRLQLAAALIEYDNDPDVPNASNRSANDSAIFAHLRRRNLGPRTKTISGLSQVRKSNVDYLSVMLPSETGSIQDIHESRRSRFSISTLQNPFRGDVADEEENEFHEEEPEVDLSSWGLDSILPPKPKEKNKKKSTQQTIIRPSLPNPHSSSNDATPHLSELHNLAARSKITDEFGMDRAAFAPANHRRHSIAWERRELNQIGEDTNARSLGGTTRPMSIASPIGVPSHLELAPGLIESSLPSKLDLSPHRVPFPSADEQGNGEERNNAFAPPLPLVNRLSRFDPKVQERVRTVSHATYMSQALTLDPNSRSRKHSSITSAAKGSQNLLNDDNTFTVPPPSPTMSSKFDPKVYRTRTVSNASFGSRAIIGGAVTPEYPNTDIDDEDDRENRPYSRIELMRPKILVMPSPLQVAEKEEPEQEPSREGFQISKTGPPLPPGAKTTNKARPSSVMMVSSSSALPLPSNSFTANPRLSMTLSQLTFRNTLLVGGQRDVSFNDIDARLQKAQAEGEQVLLEDAELAPEPVLEPDVPELTRPAGKLFGRSLIDDLEARKIQMRSKQRVFMGDQRPSMMDRNRTSTLIDPTELQHGPTGQRRNSSVELGRRNSRGKPLITLDEGEQPPPLEQSRVAKGSSVFGIDTLWEREMLRLKEIEAEEEEEENARREKEALMQAEKKGSRVSKGQSSVGKVPDLRSQPPRVPDRPPILPAFELPSRERPRDIESDSASESDRESFSVPQKEKRASWFAGGSDDENEGSPQTRGVQTTFPAAIQQNNDDDDDVPLSSHLHALHLHNKQTSSADPESDEDTKPLAAVLQQYRQPLPPAGLDHNSLSVRRSEPVSGVNELDEDEVPLALRRHTALGGQRPINNIVESDDNYPLGLNQSHHMMAAHHQQMMIQTHLRNSFAFGAPPSMLSAGIPAFAPGFPPLMMNAPVMNPAAHEASKFGRVDAWRRAVE